MSKLNNQIFLFVFILFIAGCYYSITPDFFSPALDNDINNLIYAEYAINLQEQPLEKTRGLMAEMMPQSGEPFLEKGPLTFYKNHPPGILYSVVLAQKVIQNPVLGARLAAIFFTFAMLYVLALFLLHYFGAGIAWSGLGMMLCLPIVWGHSVSMNFEQPTLFFSLIAAWLILSSIEFGNSKKFYFGLLFIFIAMLNDWPSHFFLIVPALYAISKKRYSFLAFMGMASVAGAMIPFWWNWSTTDAGAVKGSMNFVSAVVELFTKSSTGGMSPVLLTVFSGIKHYWKTEFAQLRYVVAFGLILSLFNLSIFKSQEKTKSGSKVLILMWTTIFSAALFNEVLFYQWASTHSHWKFYYIPLIGLSPALLIFLDSTYKKALLVIVLFSVSVGASLSSVKKIKSTVDSRHHALNKAEEVERLGLGWIKDPETLLIVFSDEPYRGFQATNRAFFQRPLKLHQDVVNTFPNCRQKGIIILTERQFRQENPLPGLNWIHLKQFYWYVFPLNQLTDDECTQFKQLN